MRDITLKQLKELRNGIIYIPNRESARFLFTIFKPNPRYSRSHSEINKWISYMDNYDQVCYLILDGAVDSYCSLEFFIEEQQRYENRGIHIYKFNYGVERYNIGDTVKIRKDLSFKDSYLMGLCSSMMPFRGRQIVIEGIRDAGSVASPEKVYRASGWWWSSDMFEENIRSNGVLVPWSENMIMEEDNDEK